MNQRDKQIDSPPKVYICLNKKAEERLVFS